MKATLRILLAIAALVAPAQVWAQGRTAAGAGSGVLAGAVMGGPIGALIGGLTGAAIGATAEKPQLQAVRHQRRVVRSARIRTVRVSYRSRFRRSARAPSRAALRREARLIERKAARPTAPQPEAAHGMQGNVEAAAPVAAQPAARGERAPWRDPE